MMTESLMRPASEIVRTPTESQLPANAVFD